MQSRNGRARGRAPHSVPPFSSHLPPRFVLGGAVELKALATSPPALGLIRMRRKYEIGVIVALDSNSIHTRSLGSLDRLSPDKDPGFPSLSSVLPLDAQSAGGLYGFPRLCRAGRPWSPPKPRCRSEARLFVRLLGRGPWAGPYSGHHEHFVPVATELRWRRPDEEGRRSRPEAIPAAQRADWSTGRKPGHVIPTQVGQQNERREQCPVRSR